MAQSGFVPIVVYHSNTPGASPSAGNMAQGEIAFNIPDKIIYTKDNSNNIVPIGGGSAVGLKCQVANQFFSSNTTPANATDIFFPVLANTNYSVQIRAWLNSTPAAGFRFGFTGPSGINLFNAHWIFEQSPAYTVTGIYQSASTFPTNQSVVFNSAGNVDGLLQLDFRLGIGATAGTVQFQFAQQTSSANVTGIYSGSSMQYAVVT